MHIVPSEEHESGKDSQNTIGRVDHHSLGRIGLIAFVLAVDRILSLSPALTNCKVPVIDGVQCVDEDDSAY
ncbi:unnamed protein product [Echinostoma caproni]|uniref:Uncharacterized protein n=1 Tax=Echinostoma caproni TaxID=27848 RepID=A0A183A2N8_9TREM|nr:unnamed protein product [Echinostoma caproni]